MENKKTYKVALFGSLREDIYFEYDFLRPMENYEKKVNTYNSVIGGSVYNTARYLAGISENIDLDLYTWNHEHLIKRVGVIDKLNIIPIGKNLSKHPISIIGVARDGEKRMLSCDGDVPEIVSIKEIQCLRETDLFYTSLYEVNSENLNELLCLFDKFRMDNMCIFIDLCPLVGQFEKATLQELMKRADIISGNTYEYKRCMTFLEILCEKDLCSLFPNIKMLIKKKGGDGASWIVKDGENVVVYDGIVDSIINATNTTGCGDVFNAVVINCICNRVSIDDSLKAAIKSGSEVAEGGLKWN